MFDKDNICIWARTPKIVASRAAPFAAKNKSDVSLIPRKLLQAVAGCNTILQASPGCLCWGQTGCNKFYIFFEGFPFSDFCCLMLNSV